MVAWRQVGMHSVYLVHSVQLQVNQGGFCSVRWRRKSLELAAGAHTDRRLCVMGIKPGFQTRKYVVTFRWLYYKWHAQFAM